MNFHSDDFGYNAENDRKLLQLIETDKLQGVSVLATMVTPESLHALAEVRKHKKIKVALHFNIIEGKPLSPAASIPSLVSHKGTFFPLFHLFLNTMLGKVEANDVAVELKAQLDYLKSHGIEVTVIDSHQHTNALSPVAEVCMRMASEYDIPEIRKYGHIKTHTGKARAKYLLLRMMAFMTHLAVYDRFSLPSAWDPSDETEYTFMSWESSSFDIMNTGSKNTWYVVHPGLGYDTNTRYESYFAGR